MSTDDQPFIADRFQSTIPFYIAHRPRYPDRLMAEIVRRTGTGEHDPVLDLGCGTGMVALGLARQGLKGVVGLDPDPAMVEAARAEAERAEAAVRFALGSSRDLSPAPGPLKLVTMGRSFHWMERAATLDALDACVAPDGAIVVLTDMPEVAPENWWKGVMRELQYEFTGRASQNRPPRLGVLLDSAFSSLERYAVVERRPMTVDAIVGRAFTLLESSPKALGPRMGRFEAELRRRLLDGSPDGAFTELCEFDALIARRP